MASTSGLLPDSLRESLQSLIDRVNGCGANIQVVLLSTTEGVSLGRVMTDTNWDPDVLANLESTWAPPGKQIPLLGLGSVQSITAQYEHLSLVHVYWTPVVVTIVCTTGGNMGAVKSSLLPALRQLLEPLCQTLLSSLMSGAPQTGGQAAYYQ